MTADNIVVAADLDEPVSLGTPARPRLRYLCETVVALVRGTDPDGWFDWHHMTATFGEGAAARVGASPEVREYVLWGAKAGFLSAQAAFNNRFLLPTHLYGWGVVTGGRPPVADDTILFVVPRASGPPIQVEAHIA